MPRRDGDAYDRVIERNARRRRWVNAGIVVVAIAGFALFGCAIYVVAHFIIKFW